MNPWRGEASLEIGDTTYTLVMDVEAIVQIEDVLDLAFSEIIDRIRSGRPIKTSVARALLWGALRDRHPSVTLKEAGEIVMRHGAAAGVAVISALSAAMPQPGDTPADPQ